MKLSQDQIQELYSFTRKHFVEHYDLQTELVDHLANGIEQTWEEHPKMSFKEALQKEFRKFGVFGFQDVIAKKTRAMEKRYWKVFFRYYREYFKIPKVLLLMGTSMLLWLVLQVVREGYQSHFVTIGLCIFLGTLLIKIYRGRKKIEKKDRKWLMEEMIKLNGNSFMVLNLIIQVSLFPGFFKEFFSDPFWSLILSFLIVFIALLFYVMVYIIPPKAEELLAETYPEYKMVS